MLHLTAYFVGLALANPTSGLEPVGVTLRHGDFIAAIQSPSCYFEGVEVSFDTSDLEASGIAVDTTLYGSVYNGRRVLWVDTASGLILSMAVTTQARLRMVGALFSSCEVEDWLTNRETEQAFTRSERRVVSALLVGRLMALRAARMRARGADDLAHRVVPQEATKLLKRRHFASAAETMLAEIRALSPPAP